MAPDEMRRLAFIKYLYGVAVEQSRHPQPMKAASVLTFHDAVELFLELATEHFGVWKKGMLFHQYFEQLEQSKALGRSVPWQAQMSRLNTARVGLKHHSNLPDELSIEEFRSSVTGFFETNTPLMFDGLEFAGISMVHLVQSAKGRESLEKVEDYIRGDKLYKAINEVSFTLDRIIADYEEKATGRSWLSPHFFGGSFEHEEFGGLEKRFIRALSRMQNAVTILSLGLDFRRYARFLRLTPGEDLSLLPDASEEDIAESLSSFIPRPTIEGCRFCFDFVIDCALRLQEFDFDVK